MFFERYREEPLMDCFIKACECSCECLTFHLSVGVRSSLLLLTRVFNDVSKLLVKKRVKQIQFFDQSRLVMCSQGLKGIFCVKLAGLSERSDFKVKFEGQINPTLINMNVSLCTSHLHLIHFSLTTWSGSWWFQLGYQFGKQTNYTYQKITK